MPAKNKPPQNMDKSMLLARCVQLAYSADPPLSQKDIAEKLGGIDQSYVSRLLKEAHDKKLVSVQINLPQETQLACALMDKYNLKHARVVYFSEDLPDEENHSGISAANMFLGQAAAKFLEEENSPLQNNIRIGISCGTTLLEMIMAFTRGQYRDLKISPLTIEGLPDFVHQAPSTLVGLLKAKFFKGTEAYGPQFISTPTGVSRPDNSSQFLDAIVETVRRKANLIDLAIVGIGEVNFNNRELAFTQIMRNAGVTAEDLLEMEIAGEISNRPYNRDGKDMYDSIPGLREHTRALELSLLQDLVKDGKCVLAVAGGRRKHEAIRVALKAGYINGLVTDIKTARFLCPQQTASINGL